MRTVLVIAAVVLCTGCGGSTRHAGPLDVVAAENTYGDIVRQIGGPQVEVTSVLKDPNADPHLFEPGTTNGLAVARARVVVQNGLGYDTFMDKLESASPSKSRIVVSIQQVLGASDNPHLWYDVPKLPAIGAAIERALAQADPKHAPSYRAGLVRFDHSLAPLDAVVAAIAQAHPGAPVAYTEPVPGYLLEAAGLRNVAPEAFTRAIEDGTEPPPDAVSQMLALMHDRRVRVLLYNDQAVSPITTRVRSAARAAGIPVIGVSETLPPGLTFQSWQIGQARALQAALAG
jgi:zinc/manganese transport system substrate-binding protein